MNKVRAIAIYLPQFHSVPENDKWWGKDFTEWTNVKKAQPLFKDHYQPHIPSDLGYYDLRSEEIREKQAELARQHGIYGFCYYHYWFHGKQILETPLKEVLESGKPGFPFMICWANENWTRTWDGRDDEVLQEQTYSEEDDRAHIRFLIPYLKDERYITVNGKPVVAIYKSALLPDAKRTIDIFREEAKRSGLELYICRFENHGHYGQQYMNGFDAAIDFQPFSENLELFRKSLESKARKNFGRRLLNKAMNTVGKSSVEEKWERDYYNRLDYNEYVEFSIQHMTQNTGYKIFPGIFPGWDNTARKGNDAVIFRNANPKRFKDWFESILIKFKPFSKEENFIFINAWNEWAEGNHLEPCTKWDRQYLESIRDSIKPYS